MTCTVNEDGLGGVLSYAPFCRLLSAFELRYNPPVTFKMKPVDSRSLWQMVVFFSKDGPESIDDSARYFLAFNGETLEVAIDNVYYF